MGAYSEMEGIDRSNSPAEDDVFASWYRDHHERLRRLCVRILGDSGTAEDIAQETLLRAWLGRDRMRDEDLGAWLSVVARNLCISHIRKRWRAIPCDVLPEIVDHAHDPAAVVERAETRRSVRRALEEVGDRHRRLLMLREVGDIEYAELGEELGLTEGGTRALLFRARRSLRERLAAAGEGLGAWLAGVRVRAGTAARRVHSGFGFLDGGAGALQLGLNVALVAGFALSGFPNSAQSEQRSAPLQRPLESVVAVSEVSQGSPADSIAVPSARPVVGSPGRPADNPPLKTRWDPGPKLGDGGASGGVDGPLGIGREINLNFRWTDDPTHDSKTFLVRDRASEAVCPQPGLCDGASA